MSLFTLSLSLSLSLLRAKKVLGKEGRRLMTMSCEKRKQGVKSLMQIYCLEEKEGREKETWVRFNRRVAKTMLQNLRWIIYGAYETTR